MTTRYITLLAATSNDDVNVNSANFHKNKLILKAIKSHLNGHMPIFLKRFGGREENDRRNYFMINLNESMGPHGSAVRHASVARHFTDCATWPAILVFIMST